MSAVSKKYAKSAEEFVDDALWWISEFYPSLTGIIQTIYTQEDDTIPTMGVKPAPDGCTWLLYNPDFVVRAMDLFHIVLPSTREESYGRTYICNVVKHEIYHILLGHWDQMVNNEYDGRLWNLATDTIINAQVEWGEGQFTSTTFNPKQLNHEPWVNYRWLKDNQPMWQALTVLPEGEEDYYYCALVSPMATWGGVQKTAAEAVAKVVLPHVERAFVFASDAQVCTNRKPTPRTFTDHQAIVSITGSITKTVFDRHGIYVYDGKFFPEEVVELLNKAQPIWLEIFNWMQTEVIDHGLQHRPESIDWYHSYEVLYKLLKEFLEALGMLGKQAVLIPGMSSGEGMPMEGDGDGEGEGEGKGGTSEDGDGEDGEEALGAPGNVTKEAAVVAIADIMGVDEEFVRSSMQGKGWSNTLTQGEVEIVNKMMIKDEDRWATLFDKSVGRSRRYQKTKTFYRPDRRWGEIWPGTKKKWFGAINIAVDTSGSVPGTVLERFFNQLLVQQRKHSEVQLNLVLYHSSVYDVIEDWKAEDGIPEIRISGTNFKVALDELARLHKENNGLNIMFTDGYCTVPRRERYTNSFRNWLAWVIWPDGDSSGKWGSQGIMQM